MRAQTQAAMWELYAASVAYVMYPTTTGRGRLEQAVEHVEKVIYSPQEGAPHAADV